MMFPRPLLPAQMGRSGLFRALVAPALALALLLAAPAGPISIGPGVAMAGYEIVDALSALAAQFGIGHGIHVGETALGIKGRIGFEAGSALILIAALEATQGSANWLWYVGIIYIFGRLAHGLGMDGGTLGKGRMVGTLITLLTLLGLAGYALWSVYSKLG